MGEILRYSFGDRINYDDPTDPLVKRLLELQKSDNPFDQGAFQWAKKNNRSREAVKNTLQVIALGKSQEGPSGRTPDISMLYPNISNIGIETHHQASTILDGPPTGDGDMNNVIQFPESQVNIAHDELG